MKKNPFGNFKKIKVNFSKKWNFKWKKKTNVKIHFFKNEVNSPKIPQMEIQMEFF